MSSRSVKSSEELEVIADAAKISVQILTKLRDQVKVGIEVAEIDRLAGVYCQEFGVVPAFKGVPGEYSKFPANMCICINDQVLHGIAQPGVRLEAGDLVKLDFGIIYKGFYTDHCMTVAVEKVSAADEKLLKIGKLAVETAVTKAVAGNYTGDLGFAMQTISEMAGFNVLKGYVGHAIGRHLHETPQIPAYGEPKTGFKLQAGMVLCVEAQVVAGDDEVFTEEDGWTISMVDGKQSVMFEYMVEVGQTAPKVLTDTRNWPLVV